MTNREIKEVIEEAIFSTPIPKDKKFLDSVEFLQILNVKYVRIHSLIMKENSLADIQSVLGDLGKVEEIISNIENLTFVKYIIGTKYVELGLKYDKDEYFVKGISKLDSIDEERLPTNDLKGDYYRMFSRAILVHFNNELKVNENYQYSFDNIEPLLKAKYFLFKLYNYLIEEKLQLKTKVEATVMSNLISVLIFLNRWNEPFFILDRQTVISEYSPGFLNYLKAHTLNEIAWHTCCTIYPAMTYEIKRFIKEATVIKELEDDWREDLLKVNKDVDEIIKKNEFNLEEFEKNYGNTKKALDEHNGYRKWVLKNHFALCEHAMYCFCGNSKADDLKIKSNHEHTKILWVEQFEILLDKIKGEYNLARYFLYMSEDDSRILYKREDELEMSVSSYKLLNNSTSDFLIQAFKSAYSILDKIARGIDVALEINYGGNIYFHDCWERVKSRCQNTPNRYLYSLYSIARDLELRDKSKYSAFKEYRKWRNLIEHEYLFLVNNSTRVEDVKVQYPIIKEVIRIDEFRKKTEYFLQLCRSAIFSFTFFIRRESKQRTKVAKDSCSTGRDIDK